MLIVGGLCTHNTPEQDLLRAVASLRSACDLVLAFDDGSEDDTVKRARGLCDLVFASKKPEPRLLCLRRAMLYAEAERLGATWFVTHDDDEEFSPTLKADLRESLVAFGPEATALHCVTIQYHGDRQHRRLGDDGGECIEVIAWRCQRGYSYYTWLAQILAHPEDTLLAWHAPRAPTGAAEGVAAVATPFPKYALLHYARDSQEKLAARRAWSAKTGLKNSLDDDPPPERLIEVPAIPEWSGRPSLVV